MRVYSCEDNGNQIFERKIAFKNHGQVVWLGVSRIDTSVNASIQNRRREKDEADERRRRICMSMENRFGWKTNGHHTITSIIADAE